MLFNPAYMGAGSGNQISTQNHAITASGSLSLRIIQFFLFLILERSIGK
jgi:hypothetical protein